MKRIILFAIFLGSLLFPASAFAAEPVLITDPFVSGNKAISQPLEANPGTWENMESGAYVYEWQRLVNGDWTSTADFDANYIPGNMDVGRRLRVEVTAINTFGEATATSPSYYIRGSGVNGVGIYPHVRGQAKINGRLVDWGRVICNEGYCKIKQVKAKVIFAGRSYRVRARFQKSQIGPNRIAKIKLVLPQWLAGQVSSGMIGRMYVRASSSNGDVLARKMRTRIVS